MDVSMQSKLACHFYLWFWKFMESVLGILFTLSFFALAMFHWFCFSLQQIYNMTVIKRYQAEHQLQLRPLEPPELLNYADLQPLLNFQQFIPINNMHADAA